MRTGRPSRGSRSCSASGARTGPGWSRCRPTTRSPDGVLNRGINVLADISVFAHDRPMTKPLRIAFLVYPGIQALDLSGPLELFARATRLLRDERKSHPGYAPVVVGTEAGALAGAPRFRFPSDTTYPQVRSRLDTLPAVGGIRVASGND